MKYYSCRGGACLHPFVFWNARYCCSEAKIPFFRGSCFFNEHQPQGQIRPQGQHRQADAFLNSNRPHRSEDATKI